MMSDTRTLRYECRVWTWTHEGKQRQWDQSPERFFVTQPEADRCADNLCQMASTACVEVFDHNIGKVVKIHLRKRGGA